MTPTERQIEVLRLLAEGHTTTAIAHTLGVTVSGVQSLKAGLFMRLDVRCAAQAVAVGYQRGILTLEGA